MNQETEHYQEIQHAFLRRCSHWDYSQPAIYFITVVLADRRSQSLGEKGVGHFSALGNRYLLQQPIIQVQCSRK